MPNESVETDEPNDKKLSARVPNAGYQVMVHGMDG